MYTIGLDIGTQGVRGMVVDAVGRVVAQARASFSGIGTTQDGWHEQDPMSWWIAAKDVLSSLTMLAEERGVTAGDISALAVDGTSGTVLALDTLGNPLTPGMMYNDSRAGAEAQHITQVSGDLPIKLGYQFNASYALPKWLWVKHHQPDLFAQARYLIHQTDYIVGQLTGCYTKTDWSNALKSGWDLIERRWPAFIESELGIPLSLLPQVQAPGTLMAQVSAEGALETGLREGLPVVAGCTDGYASSVASGAMEPGDCNTTIGTTMVFKAVSRTLIKDDAGRVYCHLHPDGWWIPGAASNVGGYCLNAYFDPRQFEELDAQVAQITPTGTVIYPLTAQGERFPFLRPDACAFVQGDVSDDAVHYAALMEGVAYTERLSYEIFESLGCHIGDRIFITGGAVKSPEWSQLRADILGKTLLQPREEEAAMGAAILAAAATLHPDISTAVHAMVQIRAEYKPDMLKHAQYASLYTDFKALCAERGWL